ncbi:MAG: PAS domain S-box protein [bacterium]
MNGALPSAVGSATSLAFAAHLADSPDGCLLIDPDGATIFSNSVHRELWEFGGDELSETSWQRADQRLARVTNPEALAEFVEQTRSNPQLDYELTVRLCSGRSLQVHSRPLHDGEGNLLGRSITSRDVTRRVTAEAKLVESESRFRALVESLPVGVVLQYQDGRIGAANPKAEKILGRSFEDLAGLTSKDPRWGASREDGSPLPAAEHPAAITLATGMPCRNVVLGIRRADGERRWVQVSSEPLRPAVGLEPAVVVSFMDITDLRAAEQAAGDARTAMALRELSGSVAHTANNALAVVLGNAYIATLDATTPEDRMAALTEIMDSATGAAHVLHELLATSLQS